MGKEDSAVKQWLSDEERYADLFNAVIFEGKQVVKPEHLNRLPGESNLVLMDKKKSEYGRRQTGKRGIEIKRYRDIVMSWKDEVNLAVLACEAQSYIDYTMPFRVMMYDGLTYNEQKNYIWKSISDEEKKYLSVDERLSNYRKGDKIIPTITIVLYYKEKDWDGALDLHNMIDFNDENTKEILKKFIPNYHINLININKIDDFSVFKSDLQIIFNMVKYKKNKNELYNYAMDHREYFEHISNDSIRALGELLNATELLESFIEEGKEEQDMCKALYDLINDSKEEGREEIRKERDEERNRLIKAFIKGAKRLGYEEEDIKEALLCDYGLSDDEIAVMLR